MPRKTLRKFTDLAIDSCEEKRGEEGLLGHVPCYVGFHCWFAGDELRKFFWDNDYHWRFQNHAFFGSLNNVIRARRNADTEYEKVIILMLGDETIQDLIKMKRI